MKKRYTGLFAGALALALMLSACGGGAADGSSANSGGSANASGSGQAASSAEGSANADGGKTVYRTLDEIKESGTINIGVFSDKNPFGYVDENGEYQGYDI